MFIQKNGALIPVTSNSDKNVVSGKFFARNEFGISKGTFWSPNANLIAFYQKDETDVHNYPLLDIESSVGKEIEYQLLSGQRLVKNGKSLTNAYREATLAGNMEQQADIMKDVLETQSADIQLSVLDIAGKVVHNQFIAGGINQTIGTLDLQNLANGVYILQATANVNKSTVRLVIQK